MNTKYYKVHIRSGLMDYCFDTAKDNDTKAQIMSKVNDFISKWDTYGERFYALLYFYITGEGMRMSQEFRPNPISQKDYMTIIEEFVTEWKRNPELRKAKAITEML